MSERIDKLEKFFSRFKPISYRKKELIFQPDEEPDSVFYLKDGYVRMYSVSEKGKELTLNIFKPGSYFPMIWAIGDIPNYYYYETMMAVTVYKTSKDQLIGFLKKEPLLLYELTKRIIIGTAGILTRLEYLLFGDAYQRVTSSLLLSARRFGLDKQNGEVEIQLPLTHQEVANLACLTRESTSLEMRKLAKNNLVISQKRKLIIKSMDRLRKESLMYIDEEALPYTF